MKCFTFDRDQTVDVNEGPVPLSLIKRLKEDHIVFAHGNQKLCDEAGISGVDTSVPKPRRLEIIKDKSPNAEKYIVIDDADLSGVELWEYYTPQEFVDDFG